MSRKTNDNRICRWKKVRGRKSKRRREVKVSDVTAEGFCLHTFNRDYYVRREDFPWFKDATQREIQDVRLFPCGYDDPTDSPKRGDVLRWELLDVDLCTNTFEYPDRFKVLVPSVRGVIRLDLFNDEKYGGHGDGTQSEPIN